MFYNSKTVLDIRKKKPKSRLGSSGIITNDTIKEKRREEKSLVIAIRCGALSGRSWSWADLLN